MAKVKKTLEQLKEEYLHQKEAKNTTAYQKAVTAYTKALEKEGLHTEADDMRCQCLVDLMAHFGTKSPTAYECWTEYIKACSKKYVSLEEVKSRIKMALSIVPQDSELYFFVHDDYIVLLKKAFESELHGMAGERCRIAQFAYGPASKGSIVNYMCEASTLSATDAVRGREMITLAWKEAQGCKDLDSSLHCHIFLHFGAILVAERKGDELKRLCYAFISGNDHLMASVAYFHLGQYALDGGNDDDAEALFTRGLAMLTPKDKQAHRMLLSQRLIELYEKKDEIEKAYELAKKTIKLFKGNRGHVFAEIHYHAAKDALELDLINDALIYATRGFGMQETPEDKWLSLMVEVYERADMDYMADMYRSANWGN